LRWFLLAYIFSSELKIFLVGYQYSQRTVFKDNYRRNSFLVSFIKIKKICREQRLVLQSYESVLKLLWEDVSVVIKIKKICRKQRLVLQSYES